MRAVVPGEPVLSGGRGQDEWQDAIRQVTGGCTLPTAKLPFVVSSLRRRGQRFDLDNLVHPVLMVFDEPIDSMSARLYVGDSPCLLIEDGEPDPPQPSRSVYLPMHSSTSHRNRPAPPEIASGKLMDEHEGVGISLAFDRADIPIRRGWFGPTEAVIDDLTPWLGTYQTRELIADHRMRDLRIKRGIASDRTGVQIDIWYVPDDDVIAPPGLAG